MRLYRLLVLCLFFPLLSSAAEDLVEMEKMTWPEIKQAIQAGKTTALLFNGGTEQRGPQNTTGGHNLIAKYLSATIARQLGNALAAPVIPYSVNHADPAHPGTLGLSPQTFAAVNSDVVEQLIQNGFRNVVLLGDHGGGQKELKLVADRLQLKYRAKGVRVVYCDDVYRLATDRFDQWLQANGYPLSTHAGIPDTSEMLYLGGNDGWVRKELVANALGDPVGKTKRIDNGITGDARRATAELGKRFLDLRIELAVKQIRQMLRSAR
ncbi:creatininase family protein [Bryobacter aggregatus]|uniref:creatininase family protein n=1 Tax=Bryobacter aggregatus TaxID=360054 RepID=UPI000689B0F4|nr:creatininase family protein [Bryobacter aggregatus]